MRLKHFDLFPSVSSDFSKSTITGAIVSIICVCAMMGLAVSETWRYLSPHVRSEMTIDGLGGRDPSALGDGSHTQQMLRINLNISLPALPCAIVSVDSQDVMGGHHMDETHTLIKTRIWPDLMPRRDRDGQLLPLASSAEDQRGEGCNVQGYMLVKKVPGNFHISVHSKSKLLQLVLGPGAALNLSHVIHDLWFGESDVLHSVAEAAVNPLRGAQRIVPPIPPPTPSLSTGGVAGGVGGGVGGGGGIGPATPPPDPAEIEAMSFEYYIKIVPSKFVTRSQTTDCFQFVSNQHEQLGRYKLAAIYFSWDISPIMVKFSQQRKSLLHFIVQLCAIVGGVFTVMGLINSFLHASLRTVLKDRRKLP